jgi:ABC-type antimicrobial peptide transport system permease subunit
MAYTVSQRTREIGVRMALGAQRSTVMRLFLRDGFKLAVSGVIVGLALSFAATRAMSSLLFNVKPTDAVAFASAALLLCLAVFLANFIPARRATRVDPLLALRNE